MGKRCIVIVLDGFGIGAMEDVNVVRPQDIEANTCKHLLQHKCDIQLPTLCELGLINALEEDIIGYEKSNDAIYGRSKLAHYGCDTYFGHQEIMGTRPILPVVEEFQCVIDEIEEDLKSHDYFCERYNKEGLSLLCIDKCIFIGDNIETDPGQAINVTGSLDLCTFKDIRAVGIIVRKHVQVGRVIAFGGNGVSLNNLVNAISVKKPYIGIDAPLSGVYNLNYQVLHIGYGVDASLQLPSALKDVGIHTYLYGKVADIVANTFGNSYPAVDTANVFKILCKDLKGIQKGFFCLNVQETDLAGHAQDVNRYIDRLEISDIGIRNIMKLMKDEDILMIMADHGNDPMSGSSKHTREFVPLLIHKKGCHNIHIGTRNTMADVGATVADYFKATLSFGTSFLPLIIRKPTQRGCNEIDELEKSNSFL